MIIGERKIRGILREKEEAEAIYREARSQGYTASLLVQHRPNVFEQKVANIEPRTAIDVDIKYFHTLAYNDGWYSFVFPTVVGPRYNPPGHTDPIKAVPREDTTEESAGAAVRYLRPGERSAHDISINVRIDAGVSIEELRSSHKINASRDTAELATVSLANQTTMPNKDFVLDFQVAGSTIKSNLMTYFDPESQQGYFTLMMYPPAMAGSLARQSMEMVFVLDCSGSMNGRPLEQAKNAVTAALDHLNEGDTFQIIRFSDNASQFGAQPVSATAENLAAARQYLARLNGGGGTAMIEGIRAALNFPHDPTRLRFVSFMTDGFIGNEVDIIEAVHNDIGASRIFSFGVGTSVNRYLMERMAKEGRGAVAYLAPQDSASVIMNDFFNRISHPALTDVEIEWGGMAVTDVYPSTLPDMFVGRPVVVTGKYLGAVNDIAVSGSAAGETRIFGIAGGESDPANVYVPKIWARLRIADLSDRQAWQEDPYQEIQAAIKSTALEHQLMSDYTSFVAVDTSHQTEGVHGTTVYQAVPVPEGVRYETTVEERQ
jgi:Ca-activated chloride channel family protein